MPREGRSRREEESGPPLVVHADGTLTLTEDALLIEVTRGAGYRGTLRVPRDRCRLRVMGRAIAVMDGETLIHLCSRCKPTTEVARLAAAFGERAAIEHRTPFSTLLALREESAAYRPQEQTEEESASETRGESEDARAGSGPEGPEEPAETPPGFESLRRVYVSRAARDRDARRMRAAGWDTSATTGDDLPEVDEGPLRGGRMRGLLRAANPQREVQESVVTWLRPLPGEIEGDAID